MNVNDVNMPVMDTHSEEISDFDARYKVYIQGNNTMAMDLSK